MKKLLLFFFAILFSGCAVTQEITMSDNDQDTGELIVQFTDDIKNVRATLNGSVVRTEKKLTKEMILYNIDPGPQDIHISASSWELKDDLDFRETITIEPGKQSAIIVSIPPKSGGYWAFQIASFVVIMSYILSVNNSY